MLVVIVVAVVKVFGMFNIFKMVTLGLFEKLTIRVWDVWMIFDIIYSKWCTWDSLTVLMSKNIEFACKYWGLYEI